MPVCEYIIIQIHNSSAPSAGNNALYRDNKAQPIYFIPTFKSYITEIVI